jgi:hypothetical protein
VSPVKYELDSYVPEDGIWECAPSLFRAHYSSNFLRGKCERTAVMSLCTVRCMFDVVIRKFLVS